MKNKVSQEVVLRSNDSKEMKNAVFEVASRANSHLEKVSFQIIFLQYLFSTM